MKAINIIAIIAISFVAGMFGGAFSERVFANPKAEAKIQEQILARGFFLVDENNRPRAGMSFDKGGNPVVYVRDQSGNIRGYLVDLQGGPMLALTDEKGRDSVVMGAGDDGKSTIGMMAANNKPRVAINYTPGRGPGLALFDDDNVGKAGLAIIHGKPVIGLNKADGTPAIAMSYDPKREAALLGFLNSRNEAKAGFGLMNDKPLLFAYRPDDTGLLFNIQRDGRPALGLLTEGRPEWSATGTVPQMPALDGILDQVLR